MSSHSLSVGIVGLPNAGKSTLFNALTNLRVDAKEYPFCTIEPNSAFVNVVDDRLKKIDSIVHSRRIVYSTVEFIDIAGLVRGASKGEGLGNKFLSNIKETDALIHLVRGFENSKVSHVEGRINPDEDIDIVRIEMALKDMETLEKVLHSYGKIRLGVQETKRFKIVEKVFDYLKDLKPYEELTKIDDLELINDLNLLSLKSVLYILNVSEIELGKSDEILRKYKYPYFRICAKYELEKSELSEDERMAYLNGDEITGLQKIINIAFSSLGLISFFTAGESEVRSWTISKGDSAVIAAGKIHTDFVKNFIRAQVVSYQDFIEFGGWENAVQNGKMKLVGKDYVVTDGDIMIIKHS